MEKTAKKPRVSRFFLPLLLALLLAVFPGCFDLGMFEDGEEEGYADYYAAFGKVRTLSERGTHSYDIKDSLFNASTINDFTWEDAADAVASEPYTFIIIPCKRDMKIETLSLSLAAEADVYLDVFLYVMDEASIPASVFFYDDDGKEEEEDEDDEEEEEEKQNPEDSVLSPEDAACAVVWHAEKDKFSTIFANLKQNGTGLAVEDGQILLIYITNNTRYGFCQGKERCSFSFMNLLIRAVE